MRGAPILKTAELDREITRSAEGVDLEITCEIAGIDTGWLAGNWCLMPQSLSWNISTYEHIKKEIEERSSKRNEWKESGGPK